MPDAVLQYDFAVVGVQNVKRAFDSIERRAAQHNAKLNRTFGAAGTPGGSRTASSSAQKQLREDARNLSYRKRLRGKHERDVARAALQAERDKQRATRETAREHERSAKKREAVERRHNRDMSRHRRSLAAHSRRIRKEEQRAGIIASRERQRATGAIFGRGSRSVRGTTRAIGATAGGALAIGGAVGAGVAIDTQMRESAMASQLANQAGDPTSKRRILGQMRSVRGFSGSEAGAAIGAFTDISGDMATGVALMKDLGDLSLATGSNLDDVASAAGNFANNLKDIEDPSKRAAAIMSAMRGLAGQGLAGAVELKDLASGGATIGAAASRLAGGDSVRNIKTAGALAQAARAEGGARSADMATMAVSRFVDFAAKGGGAKRLQKLGVETMQGGKVRDPIAIINDFFDKAGNKAPTMLTDTFGEMGGRVVGGFMPHYQKGGRGGVRARFNELMSTELKTSDISTRASSRMGDADIQFKEAAKEFNAAVGQELLPVVTEMIPIFRDMLPQISILADVFGKLARAMIDSPLTSLGTIIAAKLAADIAGARIGEMIGKSISEASAKSGGIKLSGAVFNGLSLGTAAGMTVFAAGVSVFESGESRVKQAGGMLNQARAAAATGDVTTVASMRQGVMELSDAQAKTGMGDMIMQAGMGLLPGWMRGEGEGGKGFATGEEAAKQITGAASHERTLESFEKELGKLQAAASKASIELGKVQGGSLNRGNTPAGSPVRGQ